MQEYFPAVPESDIPLDDVAIASIESFPASDPPAWTPAELAPIETPEHLPETTPEMDQRGQDQPAGERAPGSATSG